MKIIHCSDLHLDSKLNTHFSIDKRNERRAEILDSFRRMAQFARENEVEAILIAGDLFDRNQVSEDVLRTVRQVIYEYGEINFYYLKGNHDSVNIFGGLKEIPDNLKFFDSSWNYYVQNGKKGQVIIAGVEFGQKRIEDLVNTLYLHGDHVNIVMLHGQESEYTGPDQTEVVPLRALRGKGIDYLALGHIHSFKAGRLDGRGIWCYSGCMEGRGFDECGERGFVLVDVEEETGICETEFIAFATRNLYTVNVDVSGCSCTEEAAGRIEQKLLAEDYDGRHMLKIVLTGQLPMGIELNMHFLKKRIEHRFYYVTFRDETSVQIDYNRYMDDETLTGEFVRLICMTTEIPEKEKVHLLRYGLQALSGEEME